MCASLLTAPLTARLDSASVAKQTLIASRSMKLKEFFSRNRCPLASDAREFIVAADQNNLDWRLLPSIAFVESGAGKRYRNNNVLGWASCHKAFSSVRAGIHTVAARLAASPLYRHKNTDQILFTYNPSPEYSQKVKAIMRTIGSMPLSQAAD